MYDKCDACGKGIINHEDCKLMQIENKVKCYCKDCFENKTKKPEVEKFQE